MVAWAFCSARRVGKCCVALSLWQRVINMAIDDYLGPSCSHPEAREYGFRCKSGFYHRRLRLTMVTWHSGARVTGYHATRMRATDDTFRIISGPFVPSRAPRGTPPRGRLVCERMLVALI